MGDFRDGIEAAARWHDERADPRYTDEYEFHIRSAAALRALTPPPASGDREGLIAMLATIEMSDGDPLLSWLDSAVDASDEIARIADAILSWMRAAGYRRAP